MEKREKNQRPEKEGTFLSSCIALIICMGTLMGGIVVLKLEAAVALLLAAIAVTLYGLWLHISVTELQSAMIKAMSDTLEAVVMILIVGILIAAWVSCGTVPYIVYLGLGVVDPAWFPMITLLMCAAMSLVTGSSWTTIGTLGVAFVGIAVGLQIPVSIVAGAVVCGAFFGDKSSPLSAVGLFISGISKINVYDYSKNVLKINLPALALSAVVFAVIGQQYGGNAVDLAAIQATCEGLDAVYRFGPVLLVPLAVLLVMIFLRVPALTTLILGSLTGVVIAVLYQNMPLREVLNNLYSGFYVESGVAQVDQILNRGGMSSMMSTVVLAICALAMAGVIDRTRILMPIVGKMGGVVQNRVGLIVVAVFTGAFVMLFSTDPFVASLVQVKAFEKQFEQLGLDRNILARTVAEGAFCICPIVPWGANGIFASKTLQVSVGAYMPFYFMGAIPLILTVLSAATGIGLRCKTRQRDD